MDTVTRKCCPCLRDKWRVIFTILCPESTKFCSPGGSLATRNYVHAMIHCNEKYFVEWIRRIRVQTLTLQISTKMSIHSKLVFFFFYFTNFPCSTFFFPGNLSKAYCSELPQQQAACNKIRTANWVNVVSNNSIIISWSADTVLQWR